MDEKIINVFFLGPLPRRGYHKRAVPKRLLVMGDIGISEIVDLADLLQLAGGIQNCESLAYRRQDAADLRPSLHGMVKAGSREADCRTPVDQGALLSSPPPSGRKSCLRRSKTVRLPPEGEVRFLTITDFIVRRTDRQIATSEPRLLAPPARVASSHR